MISQSDMHRANVAPRLTFARHGAPFQQKGQRLTGHGEQPAARGIKFHLGSRLKAFLPRSGLRLQPQPPAGS